MNKNSFLSPHCISVYVIHQTPQESRYLLIKRCSRYLQGTWQMISGGIEKNETAGQAAYREIQEETGLSPFALYSADAVETFYMQSIDKITFVPVFVAFVAEKNVLLSPKEHDAFEWLSFEDAKERLLWSEQKRVLTLIHETFVLKKPNKLLAIDLTYLPIPSTLLHIGVYGIAFYEKKLLLIKQNSGPHRGKWDLPGGRIEPNESIQEALYREFEEEVGMTFSSMQLYENITATTDEELHQIGLLYFVKNLSLLKNQGELTYAWIEPSNLLEEELSPFVKHLLKQQKYLNDSSYTL